MSLGVGCGRNFTDPVLEDALQAAKDAGITVVAAGGNGGNNGSICYPASSSATIAAGATDRNDRRASFSNGSGKLDVVAPGHNVPVGNAPSDAYPANYYTGGSGTSFSTPHVAGLAGLLEAYEPSLTPVQKYNFITKGADKVRGMNGRNRTDGYGYGRINAAATLQTAIDSGYAWKQAGNAVYADQARTQRIAGHLILAPGEKAYVRIKAKNTGYQAWPDSSLQLGTAKPRDRQSQFYDASWLAETRPAAMLETTVAPGETGTFEFTLAAPLEKGAYKECFNVVAEGHGWLNGRSVCYQIKVGQPPLDTLPPDWKLTPGQQLTSTNGKARLVLQGDGNVVVYAEGHGAVWASHTNGKDATRLIMQADGNLVLYSRGKPLWSTGTAGNSGARITMQTDGNLVIYSDGKPVWASHTVVDFSPPPKDESSKPSSESSSDQLSSGQQLKAGEGLRSQNGRYRLVMQGDGNLVLYAKNKGALWASHTNGTKAKRVVMQGDGNLVAYGGGKAHWASHTSGKGRSRLLVQNDGNLVIYSNGKPTWASHTVQR